MTKYVEVIVKQIMNYRFHIPVEWVDEVAEGYLDGDSYFLENGVEVPSVQEFESEKVVLVETNFNEVDWEEITQEIVDKNTYE